MPSSIGLVVSDVDGTIVKQHEHTPSERVRAVIDRLRLAGVHVAIASARPAAMVRTVVTELGLHGPQIIDGGATIYDFDNDRIVWQCWIDVARLRQISERAVQHALIIDCFPTLRMEPIADFTLESIVEDAPYVYVQIHPTDKAKLWKAMADIDLIHITEVARGNDVIHVQISDNDGTKEHGVVQLQRILGVTSYQTLAIGDNDNDLPLFRSAGLKIAMGNAKHELKRHADYVTSDVQHDGWADAIERFVFW